DELSGAEGPGLFIRYNWEPYERAQRLRVRQREGIGMTRTADAGPRTSCIMPKGEPATMAVQGVGVSELNERDIALFSQMFQTVLREAIRESPTPKEAPGMDLTVPAPLRFLRHAQDKAFERDVERYRLYTAEGLSFRQIARLEQQHR